MLQYTVDLAAGVTESFFNDLRQLAGEKLPVRKRLTEITLELLQNIRKHSATMSDAKLIIQKGETAYSIHSVNCIEINSIHSLEHTIEYINKLDHVQQKAQHKAMLVQTVISTKGGAGLGLYRIALRSASTLNASFKFINKDYASFSLTVTLNA